MLWFLYDSDGTRVGFTYNGAAYYYMINAQGDVTGIVDSNVNSVVEYSYDAWGKLLDITGSMADTVGKINPFLYRGYYYDPETGFYYLNSRYYDPETGRFLNADGAVSTGTGILGFNMFSYCNNDPTGMVDDGGSRPLAMSDTVEPAEDQMIAAKFNSDAHRKTAASIAKTAATAAADTVVAKGIYKLKDTRNKYLIDKGTAPIYETTVSKYKVPIPKIQALKKFAKNVGIASSIALGVDIGFDIHDYVGWDLAGAVAIDTGAFLAGVGIATLAAMISPITVPALAVSIGAFALTTGVSLIADWAKDAYIRKRR